MATIPRQACSFITHVTLAALLVPAAQAAPPDERTATPPTRPAPRLLSPEEKRLSAVEPGQLRPAQRPVPQVRIPLGQRAAADGARPERPEGIKPLRRGPAAAASATGRIDDEAARCEAQADEEAVRACRLLNTTGRKGKSV
jgi:hypothetical protein